MGIKRKIFENIGGMGKLRHGQDMEFSLRIYNAGYKVGLISDAYVYHKRRTSLKKFYKQIFNWGVARINLGKLDKKMLKPIHLAPLFALSSFIITILLIPFSKLFLVLFIIESMFAVFIATFSFIDSFRKNKHFYVAFYQ